MSDTTSKPFDAEQYRRNTHDLVDAMDRTADRMDELGDNMGRLGECFETFGESGTALREAREEREAATAMTGHAAD